MRYRIVHSNIDISGKAEVEKNSDNILMTKFWFEIFKDIDSFSDKNITHFRSQSWGNNSNSDGANIVLE